MELSKVDLRYCGNKISFPTYINLRGGKEAMLCIDIKPGYHLGQQNGLLMAMRNHLMPEIFDTELAFSTAAMCMMYDLPYSGFLPRIINNRVR